MFQSFSWKLGLLKNPDIKYLDLKKKIEPAGGDIYISSPKDENEKKKKKDE